MTNSSGAPLYYGKRFSNGRVWVEVLAQRQGLVLETNKDWSFFGHYSANLVTNVVNFGAPPDVATSLFIVWVNNADFVDDLSRPQFQPYASNNLAVWTNAINQTLSNHVTAVTTLYNKGVRTMILPNAVDITKAPYYNLGTNNESFIRQRVIDFNFAFTNRLNQLKLTLTNLTFIVPDMFAMLDDFIAHPTGYGLTNVTGYALDEQADISFTGPGTNYLFWDYLHPSAKVHEVLADTVQQQLSPVRIASVTPVGNSNQLAVANYPAWLAGFVDGSTNFLNWLQAQSFSSTNTTLTVTVSNSGPQRFYRLRFPFVWTWP